MNHTNQVKSINLRALHCNVMGQHLVIHRNPGQSKYYMSSIIYVLIKEKKGDEKIVHEHERVQSNIVGLEYTFS